MNDTLSRSQGATDLFNADALEVTRRSVDDRGMIPVGALEYGCQM
jgi:hypothetical protein